MTTLVRTGLCGLVAAALAATTLLVPGTAHAADAPGTATWGMPASPNYAWVSDTVTAGDVDWYKFNLSAPRWTNLWLGDLTADLRLDLYDAKLTLLRSSNLAGTQLESLFVSLPKGTYFVRVVGVTNTTKTTAPYVLQFTPRPFGVFAVNAYAHPDENNKWVVTGEVLNNTDSWLSTVRVVLAYYDAKGQLMASFQNRTTLPLIGPHQVGPWQATSHNPPSGYASYTVHVASYARSTVTTAGVTAAVTGIKSSRTSRTYSGVVTNSTTRQVVNVLVAGTYYDSRVRVLKVNTVSDPNPIPAKGTWAFSLPTGKPVDSTVGLSVYAR